MTGELTDAAILFRLVYQAMRRAGLPTEAILGRAGVAMAQVDASARTPLHAQIAFWYAAEELSADADVGLHLGEHLPLYRGQVIEYLFMSSTSFGDGLNRALAYQRLVSDALHANLVIEGDRCYLTNGPTQYTDLHVLRHFTECLLMGILRFFRFVTEGRFAPICIELDYPAGAAADEYQRTYGCPVILGQREARLYFDRAILDHPLWQSEPELLHLHEQLALEKLQELARFDLVAEVRRAIGATLESGETSLETVAGRLGMPARRLRTQLSEADTSFQQILSDYRCRLAKRLLAQTPESVERIVYLTGFSEPSTFYRAFKRWTGETPVEYRKRKQRSVQV
jgi:AraC-like DNA-binding protein